MRFKKADSGGTQLKSKATVFRIRIALTEKLGVDGA
jgi:hypothetical protein